MFLGELLNVVVAIAVVVTTSSLTHETALHNCAVNELATVLDKTLEAQISPLLKRSNWNQGSPGAHCVKG